MTLRGELETYHRGIPSILRRAVFLWNVSEHFVLMILPPAMTDLWSLESCLHYTQINNSIKEISHLFHTGGKD